MNFQVECARCGERYTPPSYSNLYRVSKDWTNRNKRIFVAAYKEPKTGNVWCPCCFPDHLQDEMGRRPVNESWIELGYSADVEPFIDQQKVEECKFTNLMDRYQNPSAEMLLIQEMYSLNINKV